MSEFSTTAKKKTDHLSSLLFSDFIFFSSFILSHPLYFSYFIFFSPYLFKIFSFLSPVFITTTLLLLAFLTLTPIPTFVNQTPTCHVHFPESKVSFLLTTYQTLVETLSSKVEDENDGFRCLEELEVYKIVFETLPTTDLEISEQEEDPVMEGDHTKEQDSGMKSKEAAETQVAETLRTENSVEDARPETNQVMAVVKLFEDFLQEKEGVQNLSSKKREKDHEAKSRSVEPNKGSVALAQKEEEVMRNGSNEGSKLITISENPKVVNVENERVIADSENETMGNNSLGNFGSMRKEKEWRRTLACKLFEERHNVYASPGPGGEGMDLLWESYDESDNNKVQLKSNSKKGKNKSCGKYDNYYTNGDVEGDDEYEYEEEEDSEGQLCCLQALKFSAGKMNLGMGIRPNLAKISKALKGIGWLHQVSSRHGKKGYH